MDAILIMPELLTQSPSGWELINRFAVEHKVPIAGATASTADSGAILSYAPDAIELGTLAAPLADKIFNDIPAGTIPVVTLESRLRLNYKRINELGLKVPQWMLKMANEVIR